VTPQFGASLTDDFRGIIYNCNKLQTTGHSFPPNLNFKSHQAAKFDSENASVFSGKNYGQFTASTNETGNRKKTQNRRKMKIGGDVSLLTQLWRQNKMTERYDPERRNSDTKCPLMFNIR
jgi:hypothetical protein